ncbi:hypothetical protein GU3_14590 [Oceanimonas sp. GK1]|nr:hypothetical protein GU3_14590 [Oceanimonas sp. GK1]
MPFLTRPMKRVFFECWGVLMRRRRSFILLHRNGLSDPRGIQPLVLMESFTVMVSTWREKLEEGAAIFRLSVRAHPPFYHLQSGLLQPVGEFCKEYGKAISVVKMRLSGHIG